MGGASDSADVLLTVPAAWDAKGCDMMREAAIAAGLVQSSHAGDKNWRDRLRIITEPEAAAVHCAHLSDLHLLKPSQNFIVCDAGGGTVDLAAYKVDCS
jgi:molecular chaperone DnaK (HSP70)